MSFTQKISQDIETERLILAVIHGDIETVRDALAKGARLYRDLVSALECAADHNWLEIIELLLKADANLHFNQEEALRTAAYKGNLAIVKLLVEKGADIHAKNDAALRNAASNGHTATVEFLLEHKADPNAMSSKNTWESVLYWPVLYNYLDIVTLLIKAGADIHRGEGDRNLLVKAAHKGYCDIVQLFLDNDANIHTQNDLAFTGAVFSNHPKMVRLLLARGADGHVVNDYAFLTASYDGNYEITNDLCKWALAPARAPTLEAIKAEGLRLHHCFITAKGNFTSRSSDANVVDNVTQIIRHNIWHARQALLHAQGQAQLPTSQGTKAYKL